MLVSTGYEHDKTALTVLRSSSQPASIPCEDSRLLGNWHIWDRFWDLV